MIKIEESLIQDISKKYNNSIDEWILNTFGTRENVILYKNIYHITERKINAYETEYCIVNNLDNTVLSRMINKIEIEDI